MDPRGARGVSRRLPLGEKRVVQTQLPCSKVVSGALARGTGASGAILRGGRDGILLYFHTCVLHWSAQGRSYARIMEIDTAG